MQKNKSICVEEELKIFQKKFEKTMNKHEKIMINSLKKLFQCSKIDYEKLNNMRDKEKIEYLITKIEDIKNNSNKSFKMLHSNLIDDFANKYIEKLDDCVNFYNYRYDGNCYDYDCINDDYDYSNDDYDLDDYDYNNDDYDLDDYDLYKTPVRNPKELYEEGYEDGYTNSSFYKRNYDDDYERGYREGLEEREERRRDLEKILELLSM